MWMLRGILDARQRERGPTGAKNLWIGKTAVIIQSRYQARSYWDAVSGLETEWTAHGRWNPWLRVCFAAIRDMRISHRALPGGERVNSGGRWRRRRTRRIGKATHQMGWRRLTKKWKESLTKGKMTVATTLSKFKRTKLEVTQLEWKQIYSCKTTVRLPSTSRDDVRQEVLWRMVW